MDVPTTTSAPGKIMLLGEYAVLDGAPALLCAVNRRVEVQFTPQKKQQAQVTSSQFPGHPLQYKLTTDTPTTIAWLDTKVKQQLPLFTTVADFILRNMPSTVPLPPILADFELDSSALFSNRNKIGLGSSAAICVALSAAWYHYLYATMPNLHNLQQIHHCFQQGQGSGADVAACYQGGVMAYLPTTPGFGKVRQLAWPRGLHVEFFWTNVSASTGKMLSQLTKVQHKQEYKTIMKDLIYASHTAMVAFEKNMAKQFLIVATTFTTLLHELTKRLHLNIFDGIHDILYNRARQGGILYKPTGAGGGDVGMAISDNKHKLKIFRDIVVALGGRHLDLGISTDGLRVSTF